MQTRRSNRLRVVPMMMVLCGLASQWACIGRQPAQQGTWSGQDHFKTKVSDEAGHSPESPSKPHKVS